MAEIIYIANGKEYTESELAALADQNGKDLEEFKMLLGAVVKQQEQDFQEDSTVQDANVESANNPASEDTDSFSVNTSTASLDNSLVASTDLLGSEEDVQTLLRSRLSAVGITSTEGTSFGSMDALNLQNESDRLYDEQNPYGIGLRSTLSLIHI